MVSATYERVVEGRRRNDTRVTRAASDSHISRLTLDRAKALLARKYDRRYDGGCRKSISTYFSLGMGPGITQPDVEDTPGSSGLSNQV